MNIKKVGFGLALLLISFTYSMNIKAYNYSGDANTGYNSPLSVNNRATSWWPGFGPHGIRVTLVNSAGNRVANSVSVDYSNFNGLSNYSYASSVKRSKIDYLNGTASAPRIASLVKGTYVYKKPVVSLPTFVSTTNKNIPDDIIHKYFITNYDPVKRPTNMVKLLQDLNGPAALINDIKSMVNCTLVGDCQARLNNIAATYSYYLVVEPVGFIGYRTGGVIKWIAATATEMGYMLPENPGWVRGFSHLNLPKSIYLQKTWFNNTPNKLNPQDGSANTRSYLSRAKMTGRTGYGVGVFNLYVDYVPAPPPPPVQPVSCPVTTDLKSCGASSSFKDSNDWACLAQDPKHLDATIGNSTYCPVSCREEVSTSFPDEVIGARAGTNFVFEPITISATKECQTDVKLTQWATDYNNAVSAMKTAYNNYQKIKAKNTKYASLAKPSGLIRGTACTQSKDVSIDVNPVVGRPATNGHWPTECPSGTGTNDSYYRSPLATCEATKTFGDNIICGLKSGSATSNLRIYYSYGNYYSTPTKFLNYSCKLTESGGGSFGYTYLKYYKAGNPMPYINRSPVYSLKLKNSPSVYYNEYVFPLTSCKYSVKTPTGTTVSLSTSTSSGSPMSSSSTVKSGANTYKIAISTGTSGVSCKVTGTEVINTGYNYSFDYVYNGTTYSSGTINPGCSALPANFNTEENDAKAVYESAYSTVQKLGTAIKACTGWDISYDASQKPVVKTVQSQAGVSKEYNLVLDPDNSNTIKTPSTEGKICSSSNTYCNDGVRIYSSGCSGVSCDNSDATETYTKANYLATKVRSVISERFEYMLPPNTNRYVLKPSGNIVSALPAANASAGTYTDIGYSNYYFSYDAHLKAEGNITVKYKNLGQSSKFDGTVAASNKDGNGFISNYTCPFSFETGEPGCNPATDPLCPPPCPNPGDCPVPSLETGDGINLIYRPIDLDNPFPAYTAEKREAGFNWRIEDYFVDKYITNNRGVSGKNIYYQKAPMYIIDFTGANKLKINEIRKYNATHSYDDFNMVCNNSEANGVAVGTQCKSNFLRTTFRSIVSGCGVNSDWASCK